MKELLLNKKKKINNKKVEKEWNKVKARFARKTGKICPTWSCKNLKDLSEETDYGKIYKTLYGYLSNYVHSNPFTLMEYILGKKKENVIASWGISESLIEEVSTMAMGLFLDILQIINDEYKIGYDSKFKKFEKKIKERGEIKLSK